MVIVQLLRDSQRNLREIRTPHGHWIRFSYDGLSRIARAEDDAGHWVHTIQRLWHLPGSEVYREKGIISMKDL